MSTCITPFTPLHYPILEHWWGAHSWPAPPLEFLPKTGFVIFEKEDPVCAGFLYRTDSALAWLEYVVADKASDQKVRARCLDVLIEELSAEAARGGFSVVFTSCQHDRLIERYKQHGFLVGDLGMTNLVKRLVP